MNGIWDPLGTGIIIFFRAFQASKCEYILESIPSYGKQVYSKSLFTYMEVCLLYTSDAADE